MKPLRRNVIRRCNFSHSITSNKSLRKECPDLVGWQAADLIKTTPSPPDISAFQYYNVFALATLINSCITSKPARRVSRKVWILTRNRSSSCLHDQIEMVEEEEEEKKTTIIGKN